MNKDFRVALKNLRYIGVTFSIGALIKNRCRSFVVWPGPDGTQQTMFINMDTPRHSKMLSEELSNQNIKVEALNMFQKAGFELNDLQVINSSFLGLIVEMQSDLILQKLDF